jgi:hypothetical protein
MKIAPRCKQNVSITTYRLIGRDEEVEATACHQTKGIIGAKLGLKPLQSVLFRYCRESMDEV